MGRASEATQNKVQSTTMAKKTLLPKTLLEKKKEKYSNGKRLSVVLKQIENKRVQELAGKGEKQDCASQSINEIDFYSFWLFSTFFVLFNIAYWSYYIK